MRQTRRKTFLREESERFFENNNKQTSAPSKHLLSAKTYFFNVLSIFYTKIKLQYKTHLCFLSSFVFPMVLFFFIASKTFCEPPKRFCLARMPLARIARVVVVVKIFTAPEKIFSSYFCFLLSILEFNLLSRGETSKMTTFLREESKRLLFPENTKLQGKGSSCQSPA